MYAIHAQIMYLKIFHFFMQLKSWNFRLDLNGEESSRYIPKNISFFHAIEKLEFPT